MICLSFPPNLTQDLQDLDDEFKGNHKVLLERFYRVFESIWKYVNDLIRLS